MAPKRGAASAARPAKKSKGDGAAARIDVVVTALQDESLPTDVPAAARQMLASAAPNALGTTIEERHPMQDVLLGQIREVLAGISKRLQANVSERKQAVDRKAVDLEGLAAQLQVGTSELEEAENLVAARREKLGECEAPVRAAEAEVRAVRLKQKANTKEQDALAAHRSRCTALEEGSLKMLLDGAWSSPKEATKATDRLCKDLAKLGAEPGLLASAPEVLAKKPEERKGFDAMVLESLKDVLAQQLARASASLAANEAAAGELGAEAAEKDAAAQLAASRRDAAAQELERAEAGRQEKASAKSALEALIESTRQEREGMVEGTKAAAEEVERFSGALSALEFLAKLSSAPAPQEAAAEAAGPAVAKEAPDAPTEQQEA